MSIAANDFTLVANRVPRGQPGIFYYGSQTAQVPFGNGVRCVSGQIYRLPVVFSQMGSLSYQIDFNSLQGAGAITAGSSWNFQAWYRDPDAGGAAFNLSNGYRAVFMP